MKRAPLSSLAIFSVGFRPFFFVAIVFATGIVPIWWAVWLGHWDLASSFPPVDWHFHEMIFGYAGAVIAGFLFTAVPNWSERKPIGGAPLMWLSLLWFFGRLAVAGLLPVGVIGVAILDCAFLLAIGAIIGFEIVAGRNWRNLIVVIPVGLLGIANIIYHAEVIGVGDSNIGRRLGLVLVLFLITLIGGRIIPAFTRNWLTKQNATRLPVPFGRFDIGVIGISALALLTWVLQPEAVLTGLLLVLGGFLHAARLSRWRTEAIWRSPLLLMLHIAYAFLPVGFLMIGAAALGWMPVAAGLHLIGIGAVVGMTVAVMIRATLGHTGRPLMAGPWLTLAFALICCAAVVRAILPGIAIAGLDGIAIAVLLWTIGFAILAARLLPWLVLPVAPSEAATQPDDSP